MDRCPWKYIWISICYPEDPLPIPQLSANLLTQSALSTCEGINHAAGNHGNQNTCCRPPSAPIGLWKTWNGKYGSDSFCNSQNSNKIWISRVSLGALRSPNSFCYDRNVLIFSHLCWRGCDSASGCYVRGMIAAGATIRYTLTVGYATLHLTVCIA